MKLHSWKDIPKLMDVKLDQVPFVTLCYLLNYSKKRNGTYPLWGYAQELNSAAINTNMYKVSGVLTTQYEEMMPLVVVGTNKQGNIFAKLVVPLFDYDAWAAALNCPNQTDFLEFADVVETLAHCDLSQTLIK